MRADLCTSTNDIPNDFDVWVRVYHISDKGWIYIWCHKKSRRHFMWLM